jgi:hypothetical protein
MARIDIKDTIVYDRDTVYETFRDKLLELQPYLPDIEEIIQESYERDGDDVHIVNIWKAADEEVPAIASKFIKPEMLQWTDRATWHDDAKACDWDMEVGFLQEAISCDGTTYYREKGDGTEVHITGDLRVDASKIPGVPRLLAKKVGGAVEKFVVKMITPNLTEVNRGMEKYLAQGE